MITTHRLPDEAWAKSGGTEAQRYMSSYKVITIATAVLLAAGVSIRGQAPAAAPQAATPATTGSATRGKDLYLSYSCYACHGYNAQTGNGQRLLPLRLNQQQFVLYIRTPRTPGMPAYSTKVLNDTQAADIFAYVQSLPKAPELKDVPLLNQLP